MTLVTVVIPTYNRAGPVRRAIASALGQSFGDLEVVVSDDGSTDHTGEVVASFESRVRYVRGEHSGLPAVARNRAFALAVGKYVGFLDSDDEWLTEKLDRQLEILEARPEVGLVCTNARLLQEIGNGRGRPYLRDGQGRSGWVAADLAWDNFVVTSSVLVRRAALDEVGGFCERAELRALEDFDLWLRIATRYPFEYLPEPLVVYRDHRGSVRKEQSLSAHWKGRLLALERLREAGSDPGVKSPVAEPVLRRYMLHHEGQLCRAYWSERLFRRAGGRALRLLARRLRLAAGRS